MRFAHNRDIDSVREVDFLACEHCTEIHVFFTCVQVSTLWSFPFIFYVLLLAYDLLRGKR